MRARLGWHVDQTVAAYHISAEEVTRSKLQDQLGPACYAERTERQLKGVVPDDFLIDLLALVGMLRDSRFVTLPVSDGSKLTEWMCQSTPWVN